MPTRNEYIRWKAREALTFKRLRVKKYARPKRMKCGHLVLIYDAKAGVCMECRLKEQRTYTPADCQAEMAFNTEPIGVT